MLFSSCRSRQLFVRSQFSLILLKVQFFFLEIPIPPPPQLLLIIEGYFNKPCSVIFKFLDFLIFLCKYCHDLHDLICSSFFSRFKCYSLSGNLNVSNTIKINSKKSRQDIWNTLSPTVFPMKNSSTPELLIQTTRKCSTYRNLLIHNILRIQFEQDTKSGIGDMLAICRIKGFQEYLFVNVRGNVLPTCRQPQCISRIKP